MAQFNPTLLSVVKSWWREQRQSVGAAVALRQLAGVAAEFLRDSLPDRRRQRFGDADYDWEYRVDTTSANVGWRARLIGLLTSSYQPIEAELFREMVNALGIDYSQFTFIDIGSGKGRALLLAAEYPFRRVMGVELLAELDKVSRENIAMFPNALRRCSLVESVCGDATEFIFPDGPLVIFFFHPLQEAGFSKVMDNLQLSLGKNPREALMIYANPIFENAVIHRAKFRKDGGTHQYSLFTYDPLQLT